MFRYLRVTLLDSTAGLNLSNVSLNQSVGELKITGAAGTASTVEMFGFDLQKAEQGGFIGIKLPETIAMYGGAGAVSDPPAPPFLGGSDASYTLNVDAPSNAAETFVVTLSGAVPSDFEATVGDTVEPLSASGTFSVTLAAGATNISFGLIDVTPDNGTSDIVSGANLQLTASLPNPEDPAGLAIQSTPLTFSYLPSSSNTDAALPPSDSITGVPNGGGAGITSYTGDGSDDYIAASGSSNLIDAQNSGNDSIIAGTGTNTIYGGQRNDIIVGSGGTNIILTGGGNSEIYAGSKTSIQNAIAQGASGTATGVQGDLIGVMDGNNTVVGGNGNDMIFAGAGNDVIVMGPGNDSFIGGEEATGASANWNVSYSAPSNPLFPQNLVENNITSYVENFTDRAGARCTSPKAWKSWRPISRRMQRPP
jgi:hemolysin type calcium-binding protein